MVKWIRLLGVLKDCHSHNGRTVTMQERQLATLYPMPVMKSMYYN